MVNRAEIGTAQTKKARLNIVQAILSHTDTPEFYRGSNQEATIYRSLFCVTGIVDGDIREDIQLVIDEINRYIDSCCDKKVSVKGMVYKLVKAPYGMRAGVIPFYLAYVLANRREDIIVYFSNKEVQITSDIVVNMCEQPEDYAVYVSKEDLQKEKYISELNMLFEVDDNWNLSSNRIKDIIICMQRWFRSLQQATRNVIYLDQCEIIFTPELDEAFGVRHMPKKGEHSREAKELVTEIIARLEDIPDGCAECFPFELIDELKQEYLTDNSL